MSSLDLTGERFSNDIIATLPTGAIDALRPHLVHITLSLNQVLHEPNRPIADVFFVEEGVVSLAAGTLDNGNVEVGLTGREGFVGVSAILNSEPYSVHKAFTQVPGSAYRISSAALRSVLDQSAEMRERCLRYSELLWVQTAQVAACNAKHNLPERLARWLLMVRDKMDSDNLPMTQEFLSVMLGVRRAGVSVAASTLQAGGLIRVQRGHVLILDHDGLAAASCDCYRVIQASRDRILR